MAQINPFAYLFPPYTQAANPDLAQMLGMPAAPQGTTQPDLVAEGLAALQTPEQPVTPVEPKQLSTMQFIAGALADALGGYTAGKMGRPAGPSIIAALQQRREEEARRKTEELRAEQGRKRGERVAEAQAKIQIGLGREERGAQIGEAERGRQFTRGENAADRAARAAEAEAARQHDIEMATREERFRFKLLRAEGADRRAMAKEDNKFAQGRDESVLTQLDGFIGGETGNALQAQFDAAANDPNALRILIDRTWRTAQSTLRRMHTEDGYNEAEAVVRSEIVPLIEEAEKKLEAQQGQPQGGGFALPSSAFGAALGAAPWLVNMGQTAAGLAPYGAIPTGLGMLGASGALTPGITPEGRKAYEEFMKKYRKNP